MNSQFNLEVVTINLFSPLTRECMEEQIQTLAPATGRYILDSKTENTQQYVDLIAKL